MFKNVLRGILFILSGLFLIIWPTAAPGLILKLLGALSVLIGLFTIVNALSNKMFSNLKGMNLVTVISAAIFILLGALLIFNTNIFINFINYLFGLILVLYGITQIVNIYRATKDSGASYSVYTLPILATVFGVLFLFDIISPIKLITILFGVALLFLGLSDLLLNVKYLKQNKI